MTYRHALLLCCLAAALETAAAPTEAAETPDGADEHLFFDVLPVVLSASRLAQPLDHAPGALTVFDQAAIHASGARTLGDLLRMVPGVLVAQSTGGAPIAVYHGLTDANPRGLQILIDGRTQFSPLYFGGVSWNLIEVSLADVERIEVFRGSNSAAYGANAFLGVINIITRAAADPQGTSASVIQGSQGVADRRARVGLPLGDGFVRISAERQRDDGAANLHDTWRNGRVSMRADLPLGSSDTLELQAGRVELELDAGEPTSRREPPRDITSARNYASAIWRRNVNDAEIVLRYAHARETYRDVFDATNAGLDALAASLGLPSPYLVRVDQQIRTVRNDVELQHTLPLSGLTRLVWGAGTRHEAVRGPQFYGTDATLKQQINRLFGNLEWRPGPWVINAGATWEDDSLSNDSMAPRLSANYHVAPRHTLRGGVTRAYRLPTLAEAQSDTAYGSFDTRLAPSLAGSGLGIVPVEITRRASGGLQRQRIDVQELGYLADLSPRSLLFDLRVFRERVTDRIVPVTLALTPPACDFLGLATGTCGTATDFVNGQDVDIRGAEYQLRWRPVDGRELTINQTFMHIDAQANANLRQRDPSAARAADQHMENSAPAVATMLRWQETLPHGITASIAHYRYGSFQWTADTAVGPFRRTDLRLAAPLALLAAGTDGEVSLVVEGLGARRIEYAARPAGSGTATTSVPQALHARGWLGLTLRF